MSKRQTTLFNHSKTCERALRSAYQQGICYALPHNKILENINKRVYETNSWKRLNSYYRSYIYGMQNVLFHNLFTYHLIWLHYYINKNEKTIYVEKWNKMPKYIRYDDSKFKSGFFWKKHYLNKDYREF